MAIATNIPSASIDQISSDNDPMSAAELHMPTCRGTDIQVLTIPQLQKCLTERKFFSRDLVETYFERIQRLNCLLKAVIQTNADALVIAECLDKERENGKLRGPLHGIPFLVKDNIATKDGVATTAGSTMLVGSTVPDDAHVVSMLRDAGAILLGHTNLSEWAAMRSSYYSEGYSSRGGQCRNPYNLAEHPGGSSCGSAVAVATNMCPFSLGTETDGSIMFPADRNAVVGIKPTVGLTSTKGVIPESSSLDTVGSFGKTVLDAAIALDAITGDSKSGENSPSSHRSHVMSSYASFVTNKAALKTARFGLPWTRVWESAYKKTEKYNGLMVLLKEIENAGAEVIRWTNFPSAEEIISPSGWDWDFPSKSGRPDQSEFMVVKKEFFNEIRSYLSNLSTNPNGIQSLEDIMAWNVKNSETDGGRPCVHPAWPSGQDNFERSLTSKGILDDTYHSALKYIRRKSREEGIDAALRMPDGSVLDGILVPLQGDSGAACQVAAKAGYPMIAIPTCTSEITGVPFGIALIQTAWREDLLIRYGSAIEDLVGGRPKPHFRNIEASNFMYVGSKPDPPC
ncbi:uncharacterized protein PADG_03476 [Paracoccidioides brasiliensis Pb18]|uniref:Amidase domain-containing protein n=1 Tax=Paracoccidioides brasiliensis (strain Pb18) TaxID=502780 RepID=C1G5A6_PARBD|nr:uncharacterized protein PADG_03476 [Paracoccidioides brasiliensis Pb18]EEH47378.2 hypothetical protein PADG_03476 [Paracoccidioides brasiliensis Pb18]